MTSLLSPFHFGQKHAYFHARITIHELINVPLVTGHFRARWRVKNVHGLQSVPGGPSSSHQQFPSDGQAEKEAAAGGEKRSLHHKKSSGSMAGRDAGGTGAESREGHQAAPSLDVDKHGRRERKTSGRFFSSFKDSLRSKRLSSSTQPRESQEEGEEGQGEEAEAEGDSTLGESAASPPSHFKEVSDESTRPARPGRTASFKSNATESDGGSTRARATGTKSREDRDGSGLLPPHQISHLQSEPRGETLNERVKDHRVRWERHFDVGVRIPIEKARASERNSSSSGATNTPVGTTSGILSVPTNGGEVGGPNVSSSAAASARSSFSTNRADSSSGLRGQPSHRSLADDRSADERRERDARDKDRDRELAEAWGMLGNADIRVAIKGEVSTDTTGHHHSSDTVVHLGYVTLNLGEFAPYPESPHHHHHHHHHAHAHAHHHHHHHGSAHSTTLARTETRRYLLNESRTNATLKLTIEMTHIGGSKEYAVPAVRRGLVVGGITALTDGTHTGKGANSSSNSDAGGSPEDTSPGSSRAGQGHHRGGQNASTGSLSSSNPTPQWPSNSVARHTRIPAANLKTELSHQDAARAIKEAGGHRMGFSFAAGAHHERPPEDVIEALFQPGPSSNAVLMLAPTVNRSDKVRSGPPVKRRDVESERAKKTTDQENVDHGHRGVVFEKPAHYDAISPAQHPRDSAQSTGAVLSRFPPSISPPDSRPGPDIGSASSRSAKSSSEAGDESRKRRSHSRNSSASTMKSILTNSLTHRPASHHSSSGGTPAHSSSDGPVAAAASKTSTSPASSLRPSLVHWDASVTSSSVEAQPARPADPSPLLTPGGLDVPGRLLSSSPTPLTSGEERLSSDSSKTGSTSQSSYNFNPPSTPPDVLRREVVVALDTQADAEKEVQQQESRSSKTDRPPRGLTREEALQKGYRGAGWGTLSLGNLWASTPLDASDAEYASSPQYLNGNNPTPGSSASPTEAVL